MSIDQQEREARVIVVEPERAIAQVLDRAKTSPLVVQLDGVRYRIQREDDGLIYPRNPRGLREAPRRSAGAFARIDTDELKRDLREQGEQASTGRPAE
jgi:hypothetical protein